MNSLLKYNFIIVALLFVGSVFGNNPNKLTSKERRQGFVSLFNGKDLQHWTGDTVNYKVVDNCIKVTAEYGNMNNLYTVSEYRDFCLRFDFCFTKPGINNGVGIRTPMGKDAAYYGMCEIQILDHDAPMYKALADYQVHGSAYGLAPAVRVKHRPLGTWNFEEIIVKGDSVIVTLNGQTILKTDLRKACQEQNVAPFGSKENPYTLDHQSHPGLFNEKGHIGFLGHGEGLLLRNIRIKQL